MTRFSNFTDKELDATLTGMTISEEEWNKLTDVELERTKHIFFKTPSGKRVDYIRADVLDKIRAEICEVAWDSNYGEEIAKDMVVDLTDALTIIDKYR